MKLACKDINPASTCDYEVAGISASEVASKMMAHAKVDHPSDLEGMSDLDIMTMMEEKVHE